MIFWLWFLLRLMGLRALLITGVLILTLGVLVLSLPHLASLLLGVFFIVAGVIAVREVLRR